MATAWRTLRIHAPDALAPLYEELQRFENRILADENLRPRLLSLDLTRHRGDTWRDIRDLTRPLTRELNIKNKTWYAYMVFEQTRRILQAQADARKTISILQANNWVINQHLREQLSTARLCPTSAQLRNLTSSRTLPSLPSSAILTMDYSVSARQNFRVNENPYSFSIQKADGSWFTYQLIIPASIQAGFTGRVSKPRFRMEDGKLTGEISYEVNVSKQVKRHGVLGVDLGKVKAFSAGAVYDDGTVSREFLPSRSLERLNTRLRNLEHEHRVLGVKNHRLRRIYSPRQAKRIEEYRRQAVKLGNLRDKFAEQSAVELVWVAEELGCDTIHVENLSWLASKGGKWNHSDVQARTEAKCVEHGLRMERVNAAGTSSLHPVTGEKGVKKGRDIVFRDGERWDRDDLARVNISLRRRGRKASSTLGRSRTGERLRLPRDKHAPTPRRVKRTVTRRRIIIRSRNTFNQKTNRSASVVAFLPVCTRDNGRTVITGARLGQVGREVNDHDYCSLL